MQEGAPDFSVSRFSTDALPQRDRLPFFRDVFARVIAKAEIEPLPGQPLRWNVAERTLPDLRIVSSDASPTRIQRTGGLLADGVDDISMVLLIDGLFVPTQFGREVSVRRDEAVLISNADACGGVVPSSTRTSVLTVPRKLLATMVPGLEDMFARRLPHNTEALRLLTGYVATLEQEGELSTPELRRLVVTHVHDLVALAIGASRDAAHVATGRGLRAARLRAIKADIAANISRRDLTIDAVAARHNISPSYLRKLLEIDGVNFTDLVLEKRLLRARRLLSDPRYADRRISDIALAAGFGDISYFNRAFRRRFGHAPSDVRAT